MITAALLGVSLALVPQDEGIRGNVTDESGAPIAGARITFAALPLHATPRGERKGSYRLAPALQLQAAKLPRSVTDAEGRFHVLLSPAQLALCGAQTQELELRIQAAGCHEWRRAIGTDLRAADGVQAVLPRAPRRPPLELRCTGGPAPIRGFVAIERPFRVRGNRTLWLRELLPMAAGRVGFGEPPAFPGEVEANTPAVREEGYRVTVYAAGMKELRCMLPTGSHELELTASDGARKVVAARATPARGPARATYRLEQDEVELEFEQPVIPLLGGRPPLKVTTASGPVTIDPWDPDLPLFVADAPETTEAAVHPAPAPANGQLRLEVQDARGEAVADAGIWLEDAAVKELAPGGTAFAMSDAEGHAVLRGVPKGAWRVLIRHPVAGEREATFTFGGDPEPQPVKLRATPRLAADPAPPLGMLRIDLGSAPETTVGGAEVGILGADRRVVRRGFPQRPRWLRVEGLVPGPTTLYVIADGRTVLFGGVVAGTGKEPPLRPREVEPAVVRLRVRRANGEPAAECILSLEDRGDAKNPAATSRLFAVERGNEAGQFVVSLRLQGTIWLHVRAGDEAGDVACSPAGSALEVVLKPVPKPEPKKEPGK